MHARKAPPTSTCAFFNCARLLPSGPAASASARAPSPVAAAAACSRNSGGRGNAQSCVRLQWRDRTSQTQSRDLKAECRRLLSLSGSTPYRAQLIHRRAAQTIARTCVSATFCCLNAHAVKYEKRRVCTGVLLHRRSPRSERSFCCLVASFRLPPADAPPPSISLALMHSYLPLTVFNPISAIPHPLSFFPIPLQCSRRAPPPAAHRQ